MKITLKWKTDKEMRALFSNIGEENSNCFYLVAVFHKSEKGGFGREISVRECQEILKKHNPAFIFKNKW